MKKKKKNIKKSGRYSIARRFTSITRVCIRRTRFRSAQPTTREEKRVERRSLLIYANTDYGLQ